MRLSVDDLKVSVEKLLWKVGHALPLDIVLPREMHKSLRIFEGIVEFVSFLEFQ